MGDQKVLDAIQRCSAGSDVLEELNLRVSASGVHQRGALVRTDEIDRSVFRRGQIAPSHLKNVFGDLITLSFQQALSLNLG
jgi:hypothetical protein